MSKAEAKETQKVELPEKFEKKEPLLPVDNEGRGGVADISSEGRKKFIMGRLISTIVSDDTASLVPRKRRGGSGG